ncbi:hypothetical protein ACI76W_07495, partial [Capnocytophaga canimorsus]|uniref:hypothetical protein n=1 Tax=Capnocytophaga canimorsus TaxID=28188 RepID=UPI00385EAAC0
FFKKKLTTILSIRIVRLKKCNHFVHYTTNDNILGYDEYFLDSESNNLDSENNIFDSRSNILDSND